MQKNPQKTNSQKSNKSELLLGTRNMQVYGTEDTTKAEREWKKIQASCFI